MPKNGYKNVPNRFNANSSPAQKRPPVQEQPSPIEISLWDIVQDGREYSSIIDKFEEYRNNQHQMTVNIANDIHKALNEIECLRGRPNILLAGNMIKTPMHTSISIDISDDTPFNEMIRTIPEKQSLDIILVTPGGSAEKVARFVDVLRERFTHITFILPYMCMSAGTIFCMAGDDIIMTDNACIGPIDPQVRSRNGN